MLFGELAIALDVGRQLDALGVIWLIGGSLAEHHAASHHVLDLLQRALSE